MIKEIKIMKQLKVKTNSYSVVGSNGCEYIVTIEAFNNQFGEKEFDVWLNRKNYGVRGFVVGVLARYLYKNDPYGDVLDMVENNIEDYIATYEENDVAECDK